MPTWDDLTALTLAWLITALVAAPAAVVAAKLAGRTAVLPPQRRRADVWTGPRVAAAFLAFVLVPALLLPYVQHAGVAPALLGPDANPVVTTTVSACIADVIGLPIQLVVWARLAGVSRPTGSPRRAATAYLAGYGTWLVLTPIVYAVDVLVLIAYALVVGQKPDDHVIVEALKSGPTTPAVAIGLLAAEVLIVAPVKEEVFFRGIVQPWLTARTWGGDVGLWLAAAVGLLFQKAGPVALADPWSIVQFAAPLLLVVGILPLYVLIDRLDLRRWVPLRDVHERRQVFRGIIGTSMLFATFHARFWPSPIPLFVLALGAGWLAFRRQGVGASIILHMLFNAIAIFELMVHR